MNRSIIIIGAGMGGLAAGIYGRLNGYKTQIFEMHAVPGGQCTGWKRNGYTFDACIHHLFGCNSRTRINRLWRELGAMPRDLVYPRDCVSVRDADGTLYRDLYDTHLLEQELVRVAPPDRAAIRKYVNAVEAAAHVDLVGRLMIGSIADKLGALPAVLRLLPFLRMDMKRFGQMFASPFLRRAVPLLEYSNPSVPAFLHIIKHAYGATGDIAWPTGGALAFAAGIAARYRELGGELLCGKKVVKILTADGRAAGVRLADGSEHRADIVISDADGRRTILELLDGKYMDEHVRACCAEPPDETEFALQVFFGVNRDLSKEPSALVMLLDKPAVIAGTDHGSIEMQIYGFDRTLAPAGKGVIKAELRSRYSYWKKLAADRPRYLDEKKKVADAVLALLETHLPGITDQVEATDVATVLTWERFMGGTHGFANAPVKKQSLVASLLGRDQERTLPGLKDFYFVGAWMTSTGALFSNAQSGKTILQLICRKDGKRFVAGS